jgi:hypothetical protein
MVKAAEKTVATAAAPGAKCHTRRLRRGEEETLGIAYPFQRADRTGRNLVVVGERRNGLHGPPPRALRATQKEAALCAMARPGTAVGTAASRRCGLAG